MNEEKLNEEKIEENKQNRKSLAIILLLVLITVISIGYAALSATLNISGSSTIENPSWDIDADDSDIKCPSGEKCTINPANPDSLTPDDGKVTPTNPNPKGAIIWMDGNTVYFKHVLTVPGDTFTFTTEYSNNGTIDAKVSNVTTNELNTTAQRFIDYSVTYNDGSQINVGDRLNAGASAVFKVTVKYKSSVTVLPTAAELALINETADGHTGATSLFSVTYEQA